MSMKPHYKMMPETRANLFSGMSYEEWRTFEEIAQASNQTVGNVKLGVYRLFKWGEVQRMQTGPRRNKWRLTNDGYIEPLYPPVAGMDCFPLAECWGRYTYARGGAP